MVNQVFKRSRKTEEWQVESIDLLSSLNPNLWEEENEINLDVVHLRILLSATVLRVVLMDWRMLVLTSSDCHPLWKRSGDEASSLPCPASIQLEFKDLLLGDHK